MATTRKKSIEDIQYQKNRIHRALNERYRNGTIDNKTFNKRWNKAYDKAEQYKQNIANTKEVKALEASNDENKYPKIWTKKFNRRTYMGLSIG